MEEWKDIVGYEGYYQVSSYGNVKSLDRNIVRKDGKIYRCYSRILIPFQGHTCNYLTVQLSKNNITQKYMIHRLVAYMFLGLLPDSSLEVNHKDGNRHNNCVDNLEIITHQENINHSVAMNLKHDYGEQSTNAKLTNKDAAMIRQMWYNGVKQVELAEMYRVSKQAINRLVHNKSYFR